MFHADHSSRRPSARRGAADRVAVAVISSAVVLALLVFWLSRGTRSPAELTIYCAAGLREPMEAIRKAYEQEHGDRVTVQYGGSSTLLANLKISPDADLFLPADDSYIELAKQEQLVGETFSIAQMRPVLAVKKGNPRNIKSLDDMLTEEVRISMTDPAAAATGKLVEAALARAGKWEEFKGRVTVFKGTVTEVAADLQVGAVDAGIVWDAMLQQLTDFEEAPLPELEGVTARVVAAVVVKSKYSKAAHELAAFLSAKDKGQRHFLKAGFAPPALVEPKR